MPDCGICKRPLGFMGLHQCAPIWKVWDPDNNDEDGACEIRAYEAHAAATTWAEEHDPENDYIALQSGVTVCVRGEDGALRMFRVTGESVPEYRAMEIGDSNG